MPSSTIAKVRFYFLRKDFSLSDRARLKSFIERRFHKGKRRLGEIRYVFCSDDYLLNVNRQFLQHDYYTDILTFDLSEPGEPVNAEIYISVDRVRENAAVFSSSFKRELHRVVFHGALHLCGFGDKKPKEKEKMRQMEEGWLDAYFS
jgi:probable rRNA maturation factor